MKIDCKALNCVNCCKHYWISFFPREAKKIALKLKKSEKSFLENDCLLQVQLFPAPSKSNKRLFIPTTNIPKKLQAKIKKELGFFPRSFLALPTIVFKRKSKACIFLNQLGLCKIYAVRPGQCQLFPFISSDNRSLHEQYSFCSFLQAKKPTKKYSKQQKTQQQKTAAFFNSVEKKGFQNVWNFFPKKGFLRLESKMIGKISQKEFFRLFA
ncbi:YkgJ family cysteine cluster protein [Candidatus Micrarchaeota archaeon]|nr:YkgJ family cysteine cluster protein [Candidatus Micrarchaeota archaeon]